MNAIYEDLYKSGYKLTKDIFDEYVEEGAKTKNDFIKLFLDDDMKETCDASIPDDIDTYTGILKGNYILQILGITNLSAPSINQKSNLYPRMLKLKLTDGKTKCIGFEYSSISSLNITTSPGTKIQIKDCNIMNGKLLLTNKNCCVLGGYVESLYEKWKTSEELKVKSQQRSFLKVKIENTDKPPVFISFEEFLNTKNPSKSKYNNNNNNNKINNNNKLGLKDIQKNETSDLKMQELYESLSKLSNMELLQSQTQQVVDVPSEIIEKRKHLLESLDDKNKNDQNNKNIDKNQGNNVNTNRWGSTFDSEKVSADMQKHTGRNRNNRYNKNQNITNSNQTKYDTSNSDVSTNIDSSSISSNNETTTKSKSIQISKIPKVHLKILNTGIVDTGIVNTDKVNTNKVNTSIINTSIDKNTSEIQSNTIMSMNQSSTKNIDKNQQHPIESKQFYAIVNNLSLCRTEKSYSLLLEIETNDNIIMYPICSPSLSIYLLSESIKIPSYKPSDAYINKIKTMFICMGFLFTIETHNDLMIITTITGINSDGTASFSIPPKAKENSLEQNTSATRSNNRESNKSLNNQEYSRKTNTYQNNQNNQNRRNESKTNSYTRSNNNNNRRNYDRNNTTNNSNNNNSNTTNNNNQNNNNNINKNNNGNNQRNYSSNNNKNNNGNTQRYSSNNNVSTSNSQVNNSNTYRNTQVPNKTNNTSSNYSYNNTNNNNKQDHPTRNTIIQSNNRNSQTISTSSYTSSTTTIPTQTIDTNTRSTTNTHNKNSKQYEERTINHNHKNNYSK